MKQLAIHMSFCETVIKMVQFLNAETLMTKVHCARVKVGKTVKCVLKI